MTTGLKLDHIEQFRLPITDARNWRRRAKKTGFECLFQSSGEVLNSVVKSRRSVDVVLCSDNMARFTSNAIQLHSIANHYLAARYSKAGGSGIEVQEKVDGCGRQA